MALWLCYFIVGEGQWRFFEKYLFHNEIYYFYDSKIFVNWKKNRTELFELFLDYNSKILEMQTILPCFFEESYWTFNPLMHNVPKWSDTL